MVEITTEPALVRVGTVVRFLRKRRGLSLKELAKLTGISQIQLSRIERLESAPTEEKIRILARVLEVPVSILFGEEPFAQQLERLEGNLRQVILRGTEAHRQIQNMRLTQNIRLTHGEDASSSSRAVLRGTSRTH